MRDIKFRALPKKELLQRRGIPQAGYDYLTIAELMSGTWNFADYECFEEYTGLKDKSFDEVDIYEGDLFGKSDSNGAEVFGEVYFDTDFAGFCVRYPNGGWSTLGEHLLEKQNHREVIGNIYSNPELLEAN